TGNPSCCHEATVSMTPGSWAVLGVIIEILTPTPSHPYPEPRTRCSGSLPYTSTDRGIGEWFHHGPLRRICQREHPSAISPKSLRLLGKASIDHRLATPDRRQEPARLNHPRPSRRHDH